MRRKTSNADNLSDKPKSNRPPERPLTQQRLIAFRPTYSASTVLPLFFIVGIIFVPIGISVLWVSKNVHEKVIDYTDCTNKDNKPCKDEIMNQNATGRECTCTTKFDIVEDGNFVICAVSGKEIPLSELTYWNVELQEAYYSPLEVKKRFKILSNKK